LILSKWLRELGYDSFPALIYNGKYDREWPSLPRASETNHAIVMCLVDGQERWIDPTFFFSVGKWIPDHLLNRNAIVLDPMGIVVKKIPLPGPELSSDYMKIEMVRIDEESMKVSFFQEEKNASPISTFECFFGVPLESVMGVLEGTFSEGVPYKNVEISPFNLASRKIQDLSYSACFVFDSEEFCKKQDMRKMLPCEEEEEEYNGKFIWNIEMLSGRLKNVITTNFSSYEQGCFLGRPRTVIAEITIEPVKIEKLPKMTHVDTPWFSYARSFTKENQKLKMIEKVVYKTDRMQNGELKSQAFLEARKAIKIGGVSLSWVLSE